MRCGAILARVRFRIDLAAVIATLVLPASAAAAPPPPSFSVLEAQTSPKQAYVAGRPVRIAFRVAASAPLALALDIVCEKTGKPVRRILLDDVVPGAQRLVRWNGVTGGDKVAPGGRYRIRLRAPDGTARRAGAFTLRSHAYPIRGRHADRGPIGTFGVGRNGGRTHEGYDVNAACRTPLVAARGGRVVRSTYDRVLYGNLVVVRGERTHRDYWYAHLRRRSRLRPGDRVLTGQRIGSVGATGNARTIGCHLHFEIRSRGRPIDPRRELHAWDAWS